AMCGVSLASETEKGMRPTKTLRRPNRHILRAVAGMTPDDVFDLAWVSDPRLSPDGLGVVYCVTTLDREANRHRSAIFVGAVDGSQPPRNLTSGDRIDNQPRWSPDGSRIAFVSDRADGPRQLYVIAAAG